MIRSHIFTFNTSVYVITFALVFSSWTAQNGFVDCKCPNGLWQNSTLTLKCYMISSTEERYDSCEDICAPGKTICVESEDENEFVYSMFLDSDGPTRGYFLGIDDKKKEGTWKWQRQDCSSDYFNFHEGEPNNCGGNEDCAVALGGDFTNKQGYLDGSWIDIDCEESFKCACEYVDEYNSKHVERHELKVSNEVCASDQLIGGLLMSVIVTLSCCCACILFGSCARHLKKASQHRNVRVAAATTATATAGVPTIAVYSSASVSSNSRTAATFSSRFLSFSSTGFQYRQSNNEPDFDDEDVPAFIGTAAVVQRPTTVSIGEVICDPPFVTPRLHGDDNTATAATAAEETIVSAIAITHPMQSTQTGTIQAVAVSIV